jgi:uncharacterized phage protein gp47/JayE
MRPIPSLVELQEALSNDFKSRLNLFSDNLKKVLNAFTVVISAQFKLMYLYLFDIQNNIFPDTADLEANGGTLERLGRMYLNRNPKPATVGVFVFSVAGVSGSVLRSGLTFKSNEDSKNPGQLFITDDEYTLTGSGDVVEARALGSGTLFDLDLNDNLTITEPVIGVDKTVSVFSIVEQPKVGESIDIYRQNILDAIQLEPQGGSKTDYRLWAADAQGVRKVYPYVKNGNASIIQVFVEATTSDSTDGKGTPSGTLLTDVDGVIEMDPDETKPDNERGRRPMQAFIEVNPISLIPVDIIITGLNTDTVAIRDSISSNFETYLYDVRPYIAGADLARNKNDVLYEGRIQSVATDTLDSGNFFSIFQLKVNGNFVSSYQFELGNIPFLNSVIYV